jgi:Flp pilus assembly protein TadG
MGITRRLSNTNERGTTMAEFALISAVFFMIIFGIIEFGRLLYTHNALTDATRRGARYAALHKEATVGNGKLLCVKNVVIYGESNVNSGTCAATGNPLINGLTAANVSVTYVGADTDNDPNTPATSYGSNLGTVTVTITNYTFNLSIPFARQTLTMPPYTTTLTAESAGEEPSPIATP